MKSDSNCSGCTQNDTCRQAYEKMGKAAGPNVATKAIIAFLVPILVFIGILAAGQRLLKGRFEENILTVVSFLAAVCITLLVVFVIRAIRGPVKKDSCNIR